MSKEDDENTKTARLNTNPSNRITEVVNTDHTKDGID